MDSRRADTYALVLLIRILTDTPQTRGAVCLHPTPAIAAHAHSGRYRETQAAEGGGTRSDEQRYAGMCTLHSAALIATPPCGTAVELQLRASWGMGTKFSSSKRIIPAQHFQTRLTGRHSHVVRQLGRLPVPSPDA